MAEKQEESVEHQNEAIAPLTRKQKISKELLSFAVIVFLVFLFRSAAFEPFKIPSGSMIPTLMIGDFILVNKMSYGLKVPFTEWIGDPIYITTPQDPKRGDVIVFKYPKDESLNYIKRVVGLPGDVIEIRNKVVFVNDVIVEAVEFDGKKIMSDMDEKFKEYKLKFYQATTGEHLHIIQQDDDNSYKTDFDQITVPAGHFFVMGDNRDFSYDSRYWGFVPHKNIKGKAILVWFSMIIPYLTEHPFKFRPWRIGTLIN